MAAGSHSELPLLTTMRLVLSLLVIAVMVTSASPAFAQRDPSMNELLDKLNLESKKVDRSPVPPSEVNEVNLKVHWRLWKRVYGDGRPGTDELRALVHDGHSVGWVNQPEYSMAIAALASGQEDFEKGQAMFESAQALAPDLPYPWFLEASWTFATNPADVGSWGRATMYGVKNMVKWPDTNFSWALKLATYFLLAWFAAFLVFVLGQLLRNFGIAAYDFARVMPKGFSSNQTAIILVAAVAVPGLVLKSPLVSILLLLGFVSLVQRKNERVVTALAFALFAAAPFADQALARLAEYETSTTQKLVHAQYFYCGRGCQEDMDARVAANPDDAFIRYTALLAAYRQGNKKNLQRVVEEVESTEWPAEVVGHAHNLAGAALVALAKPKEAKEYLEKARAEIKDSAAPRFNLMRAHKMLDEADAATRALQEASSRDVNAITKQLSFDRRDVNSFLMVEGLPLPSFFMYHMKNVDTDYSPLAPVWRLLAGETLDLHKHSLPLGVLGIGLVLLTFPLRRRTSTPCPRCGLARDPSDAHRTGEHIYCYPCYSTFVTGAMLDYDARVHNEKVLGRRETLHRLTRRLSGLIAPGLGHISAGWAGTGFAMTFGIVFFAAIILAPLGIVRAPQELVATNWAGQITLSWIFVVGIALMALNAALRDIPPVVIERGGD